MKLLRNPSKKKRAKAHHSVFLLDIHQISPWPALHGPLIVEWRRGSKRRGQSQACDPDSDDPSASASYDFDGTRFEIPATLYEVADHPEEMEPKMVNLYVCQVNDKGKIGNMVGGVTLDLAKLDMLTNVPARQEYFIECSQSIVEMAGGRPTLTMNLSKMGGDVMESPKKAEAPTREDSALPSRLSTELPSSQGSPSKCESMATIVSPGLARAKEIGKQVYDEDGFLVDEDDDDDLDGALAGDTGRVQESTMKDTGDAFNKIGPFDQDDFDGDQDEINLETDLTPFQASRQMPIHARRFSRDINSSFGSIRQFQGDDGPSPRPCTSPPKPSVASCNSAMQGYGGLKDSDSLERSHASMKREMQVLTALEMSVWCAGLGWGGTCHGAIPRRDEMQAPARRMARTIIGLGEREGLQFTRKAISSIKNSCVASLGDLQKMILWWSTMVILRWSFWTLVDESRPVHMRMTGFEWLQEEVSDALLSCEDWMFSKIVSKFWTCHIQPGLEACREAPDLEHFVADYIAVLDRAMTVFEDTSRPSPCSKTIKNVLKKLVLRDISVKVDVALFKDLLAERLSIFRPLTSAQGLELKILADQISAWFESNGVSSQDEERDVEKVWCLPRILSSANVIVTPKPALLDADVRQEIAPKISVNSICDMLSHYKQIEEDSREQNVDEVVGKLREKSAARIDLNESLESLDTTTYNAPKASWLTQQGIIQPLSLDMSEDSDVELEDVVGRDRADSLKELWTSHSRDYQLT